MRKQSALVIAIFVVISTGYDFYRGYHQGKSVGTGVVFVILGFGILAIFWLVFRRRNSN